MIGIQPIFIGAWNVRVVMPRISGVLYIRVHDGRGLICLHEGSPRIFLDGHEMTNSRWQRVSTGISYYKVLTTTVISSNYVVT